MRVTIIRSSTPGCRATRPAVPFAGSGPHSMAACAPLIVALGANDGLRGVSVDLVKSTLGRISGDAQRGNIDLVLVGRDALPVHGLAYSIAFHRV